MATTTRITRNVTKTKTHNTKRPTGLTITRDRQHYTLKWKQGDKDYGDGQKFQWHRTGHGSGVWKSISISKNATSKTIKLDNDDFYPNTSQKVKRIRFRVKGNRQEFTKRKTKTKHSGNTTTTTNTTTRHVCKWSAWATKDIELSPPAKPSVTVTPDDELTNVCSFNWSVNVSNDNKKPYTSIQWQTRLSPKGSKETDGSKLSWKSGVSGWATGTSAGTSGTVTRTEDTALLAGGSYTRWVRFRARGIAGASDWVYRKHVYAVTYKAKIKSVSAKENTVGGFSCKVTWEAASSAAHPIDKTIVQYTIVEPEAGVHCPSGASWTDASISRDTKGNDSAFFPIDDTLSEDQCLFIRVNTQHDSTITYGTPTLAKAGKLKNPSGLSVEVDNVTHRATVTATNNSTVDGAFLAVLYKTASKPKTSVTVGIIPNGSQSVTVQCPNWSNETAISFGVYAVVGSYTRKSIGGGVYNYNVTSKMRSASTVWDGGAVPSAPRNVEVVQTENVGTVRITWDWTWAGANGAEISWADHDDAWESTDEPEMYKISQLHAARWNISGLATGKTWYMRVRLVDDDGDVVTNGPWSDIVSIDLSSAPTTPALYLSESVIPQDGSLVASWAYSTTDGTAQAFAEICEAYISGAGITYGRVIAHTTTAQQVVLNAEEAGWLAGETHNLCVRVTSSSGHLSDNWSDPMTVIIADPLEAHITQTSLQNVTIVDDVDEEDQPIERSVLSLTVMPLEIIVTGAGSGGVTTVIIERAEDYHMDRPDESHFDGYEGEAVFIYSQTGESPIVVDNNTLIGALDDGATYNIVAIAQDGIGQVATDSLKFEVHWSHQAIIPEATVEMDETDLIAKITPVAPEGTLVGDVCDIYRLSVDRPELIVQNGTFGETYVDPYPAIGEFGGHRVVFKTSNGDYITEDNRTAWIDLGDAEGDNLEYDYTIIDFDSDRVLLYYNVDLSSQWNKDFTETKYLGGSVQGDWNPAISRTGSIAATALTLTDQDTITKMRRLSTFAGICHVRTRDGSSYNADVQVSESRNHEDYDQVVTFELSITRVDSEEFEGVPLAIWTKQQGGS